MIYAFGANVKICQQNKIEPLKCKLDRHSKMYEIKTVMCLCGRNHGTFKF